MNHDDPSIGRKVELTFSEVECLRRSLADYAEQRWHKLANAPLETFSESFKVEIQDDIDRLKSARDVFDHVSEVYEGVWTFDLSSGDARMLIKVTDERMSKEGKDSLMMILRDKLVRSWKIN